MQPTQPRPRLKHPQPRPRLTHRAVNKILKDLQFVDDYASLKNATIESFNYCSSSNHIVMRVRRPNIDSVAVLVLLDCGLIEDCYGHDTDAIFSEPRPSMIEKLVEVHGLSESLTELARESDVSAHKADIKDWELHRADAETRRQANMKKDQIAAVESELSKISLTDAQRVRIGAILSE